MSETTKKRRPVKRWIVLALVAVGIYAAFIGPGTLKPISPVVVLPAEPLSPDENSFWHSISNTMLATILADIVLILLAWGAYRFSKKGSLVPKGFYNAFEAIVEFLWNSVHGAAGKWAKRIFPVPATIFLIIFTANMIKLLPGFESIGYMKQVHEGTGYAPVKLFSIGELAVYNLDKKQPVEVVATDEHATATAAAHDEMCTACEVVPFLRGSATDLNFPFALAVIAVVATQIYGVWAQGPGYFSKFFPVKQLTSGGLFGMINFLVGLLELILEFAKILSFGFRLFGNIFAGALLLSIVGALTAVVIPAGLYLLELFFGVIQAYVFFLLATMFISGATVSHHAEDHH